MAGWPVGRGIGALAEAQQRHEDPVHRDAVVAELGREEGNDGEEDLGALEVRHAPNTRQRPAAFEGLLGDFMKASYFSDLSGYHPP